MGTLSLLWGTFLLRPYVFIFLVIFLVIATIDIGLTRSLIFTVLAFSFAFVAEYSSTRNGFPFGKYTYIEATREQELWVSNIPFMDSLSFAFLAYVSFSFSLLLWSRLDKMGWNVKLIENKTIRRSWHVILTGSTLFMSMDIIIDPVAFRGDRWFLGKIYTYAAEGEYFNIPLTNFGGWFLVGTLILYSYTRIEVWLNTWLLEFGPYDIPGKALLGPALFFCVLVFNLIITFYIGEIFIGMCGIFLFSFLFSLLIIKLTRTRSYIKKEIP